MIYEDDDYGQTWGDVGERWRQSQEARLPGQLDRGNEIRWGNSLPVNFTFTANGVQTADLDQFIQVDSPAKVWALHLAVTMTAPTELPGGDAVLVIFNITVGVGSSKIIFRRLIDNSMFAPLVWPGGIIQSTADVVVPDLPAQQILVNAHAQYNNTHGNVGQRSFRLDAAAAPVIR